MKHAHADYGPLGPLFERIVLKTTGQQLRDEGIKKVSENNENWMGYTLEAVKIFIARMDADTFTGEDIRLALRWIPQPTHPNAYGALINTLLKRKIIVPTGEHRQMKVPKSHARSTPVYKAV